MAVVLDDSSYHEELTMKWLDHSIYTIYDRQRSITIPHALTWLTPHAQTYTCSVCHTVVPTDALHGHIDGLISAFDLVIRLLEHKAINHFTFERYVKDHWPRDHFSQTVIYLKGLHADGLAVSQAILLIKNKNTSAYLEYGLAYDPKRDLLTVLWKEHSDGTRIAYTPAEAPTFPHLYRDAIAQYHHIEQARSTMTLPPRPYLLGEDWQCDYCPYTNHCWPNGHVLDAVDIHHMTQEEEQQVLACETLSEQRKTLEQQEKAARHDLKLWLKNQNHSTAARNTTTISLITQTQRRLDQSRLPRKLLEEAKVSHAIEKLKITRATTPQADIDLSDLPHVSNA